MSTDRPGFNPLQLEQMTRAVDGVCDTFDPSHHGNAYIRTTGEAVNCIRCNRPQWKHWLKQSIAICEAEVKP